MTRSVAAHTRRADAVLVAVGVPGLLTADMVKPGAALLILALIRLPVMMVAHALLVMPIPMP